MQPGEAYWTTVATVIPVIALALIVEVQWILRRYSETAALRRYSETAALRRYSETAARSAVLVAYFAVVVLLVLLGVSEMQALGALSGESAAGSAKLINAVVGLAFGLLVGMAAGRLVADAGWHLPIARAVLASWRAIRTAAKRVASIARRD